MYRFKYYYKNGSIKLSNNVYNDVKNFDSEIQKLTKNKNFKTTHAEKQDFDKFLKLAINEYGKILMISTVWILLITTLMKY